MIKFSEKYSKWNRVFLLLLFILQFFFILSCYSRKQVKKKENNLIISNSPSPGGKSWDTVRIVRYHRDANFTMEDSIEMVMKNMKMSIQRYLYFTEDTFNYKFRIDSMYDAGFRPDSKIIDSVMKVYNGKKRN